MPKNKREYYALLEELVEHDRLYYDLAKPKISDYEYDQKMQKLIAYEKEHPEQISPNSPSLRISEAPTEGFSQKDHKVPMMSLNNTYSKEELKAFVKRVYRLLESENLRFCAELKIDGASISLTYKKGKLFSAVTRGNGKRGDDVTANVKTVRSLPLELKGDGFPDFLEIRGEIYMGVQGFQKLNGVREEEGLEPFANPRNAAAGSLKILDSREVAKRNLRVLTYGLAEGTWPSHVRTQFEVLEYLEGLNLPVVDKKYRKRCDSVEEMIEFADFVEKQRGKLPFEIDGIVVKVDGLKYQGRLGVTGKAPRYAVAYKFAPEQALTKVEKITLQVGRTGVITPVAELKPVFLAGSTISRASLHNQEEVIRKDVREGDFVWIEKAGDIIPQLVKVEKSRRPRGLRLWKSPTKCPSCGSSLVSTEGEVAIRCPNPKCLQQKIRKILYFASKQAMDIEHMGGKLVEQLVEKGLVSRISDIYLLDEEALQKLEGFQEKSIDNLLSSIERSKSCELSRFIMGLGIKYVGVETAELLAKEAKSIEGLLEMTKEELERIDGIGEKSAEAIASFFQEDQNLEEVSLLLAHGVVPKKIQGIEGHAFAGKVFVLTGALENYTRDEASSLIRKRGGKVTSSVSKKVDFLLVGDEPGSKLEKAKKYAIEILSEKEFEKMLPF